MAPVCKLSRFHHIISSKKKIFTHTPPVNAYAVETKIFLDTESKV